MIDCPVVSRGEHQRNARQVGRAEPAPHQPHRQGFELRVGLRCNHCNPRARFEETASFAQPNLAGAHYEHFAALQVEEYRIELQV